jgi:hypothetical protein
VAALEDFGTRFVAGWWLHAALNRWISFCRSTRAVKWLIRNPVTRLAEAHMAEVSTFMKPTRELLFAYDHT